MSAMPRPKKSAAASRKNGGKATNKGNITSAKVTILVPQEQWRKGAKTVKFEKVLRAKLQKGMKYAEEVRCSMLVSEAEMVVKEVGLGRDDVEEWAGLSLHEARGILAAFQAATRDDS